MFNSVTVIREFNSFFSHQKTEWTEEDYALLAKAMAKYPGGTPGRWERIAHDLGRTSSDVRKQLPFEICGTFQKKLRRDIVFSIVILFY